MSTIVFVHAHPDDESSLTAGTMALAAREGHRVVVVFATDGDHGSRPEDLPESVSTAQYRRGEADASARVTGTARVAWLGYRDSGMTGWEQNSDPGCLVAADVEEAARRLADVLDDESADVVVGYDHHGNYGHPDHIRVHQVVARAVELTAIAARLLEATRSTESFREMFSHPEAAEMMQHMGVEGEITDELWQKISTGDDGLPVGVPESEIAWRVVLDDAALAAKREAMSCHASQTSDIGMMLGMPPGLFRAAFGVEFYIDPDQPGPMRDGWPF